MKSAIYQIDFDAGEEVADDSGKYIFFLDDEEMLEFSRRVALFGEEIDVETSSSDEIVAWVKKHLDIITIVKLPDGFDFQAGACDERIVNSGLDNILEIAESFGVIEATEKAMQPRSNVPSF